MRVALTGRVESMSDKLCHCARPAKLVVGDGSAEAPFELEYADEEGSGSSGGSNHSDQGSTEYFEPRQVSVEERSMLRIIEDSPEPAGPSNGPCACTNHPHWVHSTLIFLFYSQKKITEILTPHHLLNRRKE